jgi:hypothetical protein
MPLDTKSSGRRGDLSAKRERGREREKGGEKRRKVEEGVVGSLQRSWRSWWELGVSQWLCDQVRGGLDFAQSQWGS